MVTYLLIRVTLCPTYTDCTRKSSLNFKSQ